MLLLKKNSEDLKRLEVTNNNNSNELRQAQVKIRELGDQLIREQTDKVNLSNRLETSLITIKELESQLNLSKVELNQLSKENFTIETVTRDNERLKAVNSKLQSELLEVSHKCSDLTRDVGQMTEQIRKHEEVISTLKTSLKETNAYNDNISTSKEELTRKLQLDKEVISGLEASLNEQRLMTTSLKSDFEVERNQKLAVEREIQQLTEQIQNYKRYSGQSCSLSFNAMKKWDELLSALLDGEHSSGSGYHRFRSTSYSTTTGNNYHDEFMEYNHVKTNNNNNLLQLDPIQMFQQISICVERVQLKVERIYKIKQLFETQSKHVVDSLLINLSQAQERISLLSHKTSESQLLTNHVRDVVDRDKKRRDVEFLEMKSFRDIILLEHSNQMKDQEVKYNTILQQLDSERKQSEQLKIQSEARKIEIDNLQKNYSKLQEDLEHLHKTEVALSDLTRRTNELLNENTTLSRGFP